MWDAVDYKRDFSSSMRKSKVKQRKESEKHEKIHNSINTFIDDQLCYSC